MAPHRALLFGATGQDGTYLVDHLLTLGWEVFVAVRRGPGESLGRLEAARPMLAGVFYADVTDYGSVLAAVRRARADRVFNLAAQSSVPPSWDGATSTMLTNGIGAWHVLTAVRACRGVEEEVRVVQATSAEVFGHPRHAPQSHDHPLSARNPYGVGKLVAHLGGQMFRERDGLAVSNLILYPHESPLRSPQFVTRKIVDAALAIRNGANIVLRLGDGEALRDWGWAPEFVQAYALAAEYPGGGDFIIGTGTHTSVRDFCQVAFAEAGLASIWEDHVTFGDAEGMAGRGAEVVAPIAETERTAQLITWRAHTKGHAVARRMVRALWGH